MFRNRKIRKLRLKNKEFNYTKFKFDLRTLNSNSFNFIFNAINYIMNFIFRKHCIHDDGGDDDVAHNNDVAVEVHDNVVHNMVVVVRSTFLFIYYF